MSSVRRKPAKALLCLVLALSVAAVFLLSSSAVFAETSTDSSNVSADSNLYISSNLGIKCVKGSVSLTGAAVDTISLEKNDDGTYSGKIDVAVESSDLFKGAYQLYTSKIKDKKDALNRYYQNLVMFDSDRQYPTIDYKLTFPEGVRLDNSKITADVSKTNTISKFTSDVKGTQVTMRFFLGNWDDYAGFFNRVAAEQETTGHIIHVVIPFTVSESDLSKKITGSGNCDLFKYGNLLNFYGAHIVHITSNNTWKFEVK